MHKSLANVLSKRQEVNSIVQNSRQEKERTLRGSMHQYKLTVILELP